MKYQIESRVSFRRKVAEQDAINLMDIMNHFMRLGKTLGDWKETVISSDGETATMIYVREADTTDDIGMLNLSSHSSGTGLNPLTSIADLDLPQLTKNALSRDGFLTMEQLVAGIRRARSQNERLRIKNIGAGGSRKVNEILKSMGFPERLEK